MPWLYVLLENIIKKGTKDNTHACILQVVSGIGTNADKLLVLI